MRISDWSSDVCSSDLSWSDGHAVREDGSIRYGQRIGIRRRAKAGVRHRGGKAGRARGHGRDREVRGQTRFGADQQRAAEARGAKGNSGGGGGTRSEEHTSELQSLMRISYAVFCLTKKKTPRRTIET